MAVQPVIELPLGAAIMPALKYHCLVKVVLPEEAVENEMAAGSPPELQKVWSPVAKTPALNPFTAFTVIWRTPLAHANPPQSGVPLGLTITAYEMDAVCTPGL